MMEDVTLTRQAVTARIAEFYDPAGLMEPLKLQLKLHLMKLNGKDWKTPLSPRRIDLLEKYTCGFCKSYTGSEHYNTRRGEGSTQEVLLRPLHDVRRSGYPPIF